MHIELTDDEARVIREALDYKAEDLDYRLRQGSDFTEPEDIEGVERTIVILNDLIMRLTADDLEEDPDAPDDGKMLIAGILYDRETGMEADPQ